MTDCFTLGAIGPVRESGDLEGSAPITLKGPAGELKLGKRPDCSQTPVHMTPEDAERLGVSDKQIRKSEGLTLPAH